MNAALCGQLSDVPVKIDPFFGVGVPQACPEVPAPVLNPRDTWADKRAYDTQARRLASLFAENFKAFAGDVPARVAAAGPRVG